MKASSVSSNRLGTDFIPENHGGSLFESARDRVVSLLKIIDHIGTSIAIGERGDLDAAHEFRNQGAGKIK